MVYYATRGITELFIKLYQAITARRPRPAPPTEYVPSPTGYYKFKVGGLGEEVVRVGPGNAPRLVVPLVDGIGSRHWQDARPVPSEPFRVFTTAEEVAQVPTEKFFDFVERLAERAVRERRSAS